MNKTNKKIIIKGAREHNLKNISLEIPKNKLVVFTGVSGSGKSSLVFDTIYAEGQRRYVESLSSYARQFLERISKPDVDSIIGISPAIAIEQKTGSKNSRSTVGTTTEIYDYLRLLFARIGKTICFICNNEVKLASTSVILNWLKQQEDESKYYICFPLPNHQGYSISEELDSIKKRGFFRVYFENKYWDLNENEVIPNSKENVYVIVERFNLNKNKIDDILDTIEVTYKEGNNRLAFINYETGEINKFNKFYECCGVKYQEPEPRFFSFNNPFGACPVCQGFGKVIGIDYNLVIPNTNLSIMDGAIAPFKSVKYSTHLRELIRNSKDYGIPLNVPYSNLSDEQKYLIKTGFGSYIGIDNFFKELERQTYKMHIRVFLSRYRGYKICETCKGSRLRRESLQVKIADKSIDQIASMSIENALKFFESLKLSDYDYKIAENILQEIIKRLRFLNNVGLSYLTLNRITNTLSGGEIQRINLATSLGSALMETLYILDEPSIGLHPRDNSKLISLLKNLRDIGNTVLVVEHDEEMIKNADLIIDIGPEAGAKGGEIVAIGTVDDITNNKNSLTGKYLSGKLKIPIPSQRNIAPTNSIKIFGAKQNNLKNIDIEIPLNKFVVVTGVSGSGKSTLVHNTLYAGLAKNLGITTDLIGNYDHIIGTELIDNIVIVDQNPIGKTPRSNPATYINVFELIRAVFASTHQAKSRGYSAGYFSFNVPGGRCETCQGDGFIKVEMQFLSDLYLECEDCKGTRFKKEVRDVLYKGKSIVDVLNMTVDEAIEFFSDKEIIIKKLKLLSSVGLGYIKLGQPSNTLSGGEAQRIKLAFYLATEREKKHTLFIFDEPTTGLHFHDISKLLNAFDTLLERKNSLVVIEHNLDVIKCADYIIDLGPEAGENGGFVVATGTPEEIASNKNSYTGMYLKRVLNVNL